MKAFLGLIVGLAISLMLTTMAGENPLHILSVLFNSAFGSRYDFGLTLFYSTSLIFTGLSVCIAFHCGLFNIGAEGQLTVGALAATAFGFYFPDLTYPWAPLFSTLIALLAAGAWGSIAGALKAYRQSHEVIVTMMLNFIAAAIVNYFVTNQLDNPDSQNPESAPLSPAYLLADHDFVAQIFPNSMVNISLLVAIICAVVTYFFLFKSTLGFKLRATGQNEEAAELYGISVKFMKVFALFLAGAVAGLVFTNDIIGSTGKFRIGFSPDYGFVGIAVALLARNHPIKIILSAFLFGALQKSASDLDLETTYITRDFARIIQAVLIFSISGFYFLNTDKISQKVKSWIKKD